MAKLNLTDNFTIVNDTDSGVGLDQDNLSSLNDANSSTLTLIESASSSSIFSSPRSSSSTGTTVKYHLERTPTKTFPSDGISQRIRPVTMKNSKNGDFILCQTSRGPFIAYRTPDVPQWVMRLVDEIESQQQQQ